MTPRRIAKARRLSAQRPVVLTWRGDQALNADTARFISAAWRRTTRYPAVIVDARIEAS